MSVLSARRTASFVAPQDLAAQPLRDLRTSAELSGARRGSVALLFTGTHLGDGTSTIASNYALAASATGRPTLLIDANFARPSLHTRLGAERRPGLSEVLTGAASLDDVWRTATLADFHFTFLPAGMPFGGTVDLPSLPRTAELIREVCAMFEFVVIDSAPILTVTDVAALAAHAEVDTVVVVGRGQRRKRIVGTVSRLQRVGANVIGVVINAG